MKTQYRVADLFCGAGGSSTGAYRAARELGADIDLVAVNHWDIAIQTHSANHPEARHWCINLDAARPEELVPEGQLDLLMASPECTYHSRARGGKPINDQLRMSPWHVQRWATALDIRCILVENVPEFIEWGPLDENNRPIKAKKRLYFEAWYLALQSMGYEVQWRMLNAADFGDATTRVRFFLQARKDGKPIRWPEPTHRRAEGGIFGKVARWRGAREVIDWSKPGQSLLERNRPLSLKTRLRIARGLVKFGGSLAPYYLQLLDLPEDDLTPLLAQVSTGPGAPFMLNQHSPNDGYPRLRSCDEPVYTVTTVSRIGLVDTSAELFLFANRSNNVPKSLDEPVPCVTTTTGGGICEVEPTAEPFVLGQHGGSVPRSIDEPMPTITTDGAIATVQPFATPYYQHSTPRSTEEPLPTITTKDRLGLCQPMAVPYGPKAEARSVEDPLPTILTKERLGVCEPTAEPFILGRFSGNGGTQRSIDEPLPTVVGSGAGYLVEPFILSRNGHNDPGPRSRSVDEPLITATPSGTGYLVNPFLVPQFGERDGQTPRVHAIDEPVPSVTSHGAGAVVEPTIVAIDQVGSERGAGVRSVEEPLSTLTTKQRHAVVEPTLVPATGDVDPRRLVRIDGVPYVLDIRFRMLAPRELAKAMGFDDGDEEYVFSGTVTEVTKQVGNAVAVGVAKALALAVLG